MLYCVYIMWSWPGQLRYKRPKGRQLAVREVIELMMLKGSFSRRANQSASSLRERRSRDWTKRGPCPSPSSTHLRDERISVHPLIHRPGDRSPGPCGQPPGKAEVWAVRFQLHSSLAGPRRGGPVAVGLAHKVPPVGKWHDDVMSSVLSPCPWSCKNMLNQPTALILLRYASWLIVASLAVDPICIEASG